jgi:hypothetical protein
MKKSPTLRSRCARFLCCKALCSLGFFLAFSGLSSAQGLSPREEIGDLSHILWKEPVGLDAVLAAEHERIDLALTHPAMGDEERALFLAYRRLLNYFQAAMANAPVQEALVASYEKVLAEAADDKDISAMPAGLLITFIPGLVESLAEAPQIDLSGQ